MLGNYLKLEVFGIYVQAETVRESKALLEDCRTIWHRTIWHQDNKVDNVASR